MYCPNCKIEVEKGKFCPECGEKLIEPEVVNYCPNCEMVVEKGKFCPECGAKLVQRTMMPELDENTNANSGQEGASTVCPACGFPNEPGDTVCSACGYPLTQESENGASHTASKSFLSEEDELILSKYRNEEYGDIRKLNEEEKAFAFEEISTLAHKGNPEAQIFLSSMYFEGEGVEKDERVAYDWMQKAEHQGDALAYALMGTFYVYGIVVERDFEEAKRRIFSYNDGKEVFSIQGMICYLEGDFGEAKQLYEKAGEKGYSGLGRLYMEGAGVKKDIKKAIDYLTKAAALGDSDAEVALGELFSNGNDVEIDYNKALYWNNEAVNHGNSEGMVNLALMYINGQGVSVDLEKSADLFKKAANLNNVMAMLQLGYYYSGVLKEPRKAVEWFKKAADSGQPEAMYELSACYRNGLGTKQDEQLADDYLQKALDAGYVLENDGSDSVEKALGSVEEAIALIESKDYKAALEILHSLAENGDPEAQYQLAVCYVKGYGVEKSDTEASSWLRKAAESGHELSLYSLGQQYEEGHGVAIDEKQAAKWYKKAADLKFAPAQCRLGEMYVEGRGVAGDIDKGKAYLTEAAKNGSEEAASYLEDLDNYLNGPSAKVTVFRMDDDAIYYDNRPAIRFHIGFEAENVKNKALNCTMQFYYNWGSKSSNVSNSPVNVQQSESSSISRDGALVVGKDLAATEQNSARYNDLSFVVPYEIMCNYNHINGNSTIWPIMVRISIWDMSGKEPVQIAKKDNKFSIDCSKKLLGGWKYKLNR